MALRIACIILCAVLALTIDGASADNCENALAPMITCLDYLQDRATSPSSDCCSALGNVVNVAAKCLCEAANGGSQVQVNQTRVTSLPIVCKVDATNVAKACQNNNGGSASGTSSTKLSYFLMVVSLPTTILYAIIYAAVQPMT